MDNEDSCSDDEMSEDWYSEVFAHKFLQADWTYTLQENRNGFDSQFFFLANLIPPVEGVTGNATIRKSIGDEYDYLKNSSLSWESEYDPVSELHSIWNEGAAVEDWPSLINSRNEAIPSFVDDETDISEEVAWHVPTETEKFLDSLDQQVPEAYSNTCIDYSVRRIRRRRRKSESKDRSRSSETTEDSAAGKPKRKRQKRKNLLKPGSQLYQFILLLLDNPDHASIITWTRRESGEFRVLKTDRVADLWGKVKKRTMTYESMSRSLRHYYPLGIMSSVSKKLHYKFTEKTLKEWYARKDVKSSGRGRTKVIAK